MGWFNYWNDLTICKLRKLPHLWMLNSTNLHGKPVGIMRTLINRSRSRVNVCRNFIRITSYMDLTCSFTVCICMRLELWSIKHDYGRQMAQTNDAFVLIDLYYLVIHSWFWWVRHQAHNSTHRPCGQRTPVRCKYVSLCDVFICGSVFAVFITESPAAGAAGRGGWILGEFLLEPEYKNGQWTGLDTNNKWTHLN